MSQAVLVVEDEAVLARNLQRYLQRQGLEVRSAGTLREGLREVEEFRPDVVLLDLALPDGNGMTLLEQIRARDPQAKVIVMTGHGSVQTAVEAMKAGAWDYLGKPLALAEVKLLIDRAAGEERLEGRLSYYRGRDARQSGLEQLLGESLPMLALKAQITRLLEAERRMTEGQPPAVLVRGETGSGKELVARAIHFDGPRREGPFIELNCAALPTHLLEGELFGHERGAFTDARERRIGLVEAAHGGTLLLDEIGDLDASVQAKLLRLLEDRTVRRLGSVRDREVDVRFITATHRPLEDLVAEGRFRADLLYRLRVVSLTVPPLRERGPDIPLLAEHFLALNSRRYGKAVPRLDLAARTTLARHPWPGNVRELRNAMEQAALSAEGDVVSPGDFALIPARMTRPAASAPEIETAEDVTLASVEQAAIQRALRRAEGNISRAARDLGITRDTLRYRLAKHGLEPASGGECD
ncbi:sigma-54-dependent Fis family transcriptional regulator [Roseomonas sp. SSH11]|uniref:Sigma-54-dependent Fis family transcriptional regulator n=1 Tax=Pararoseomonas baculiformis TaxID=2820812 RepID=A0ABS4AED7_9PROT|nr:sigma-54 dependent transcriptional regulator [Pararoseomonas baculiformis]MBP0445387.1 sigma-54-dependent Fis family transcriptional regulator [Pararoseomonas baculiformis]